MRLIRLAPRSEVQMLRMQEALQGRGLTIAVLQDRRLLAEYSGWNLLSWANVLCAAAMLTLGSVFLYWTLSLLLSGRVPLASFLGVFGLPLFLLGEGVLAYQMTHLVRELGYRASLRIDDEKVELAVKTFMATRSERWERASLGVAVGVARHIPGIGYLWGITVHINDPKGTVDVSVYRSRRRDAWLAIIKALRQMMPVRIDAVPEAR